jgi:hypothetical protein
VGNHCGLGWLEALDICPASVVDHFFSLRELSLLLFEVECSLFFGVEIRYCVLAGIVFGAFVLGCLCFCFI